MNNTSQKQKLVDEINDVLERRTGSLTSAVRKAARLALLCNDHEHRMLFDMHLNGVNPNNLENMQIPKWPDQNLPPKWDVITAFMHDRVLEGKNIMPFPLEDFESGYEMLIDEVNKERTRDNYKAHRIIYDRYESFVAIYSRIRTRVGSFVRSVEVTLENHSALGEPPSRVETTDIASVFIGQTLARLEGS